MLLGQSKHALKPVPGEYLPVVQARQTEAPALEAYVPVEQLMHVEDTVDPRAVEYIPTGQVVQMLDEAREL